MSETLTRWLSVNEAAAHLSVNPKTIYRSIESGRLAASRVGDRAIRIRLSDLEGAFMRPAQTSAPEVTDHVARVLASAPPLTDAQRDRIASLLRTGSRPNHAVTH